MSGEASGWGDAVEVALDDVSPLGATLLVRVDLPRQQVAGRLAGPYCRLGQTLAHRVEGRVLADDSAWTLSFHVTDPCFWSPSLPAWYELTLGVRDAQNELQQARWMVGLRMLAAQRQSLYFEGRRWVFRGVWSSVLAQSELQREGLEGLRQQRLGVVLGELDRELLQQASEWGVPVAIDWAECTRDGPVALEPLWQWPAVIAVLWNPALGPPPRLPGGRNVLWAVPWEEAGQLEGNWPGPLLDLVELPSSEAGPREIHSPRPVWAVGQVEVPGEGLDAAAARRACERLQERAMPALDAAGYLIRPA